MVCWCGPTGWIWHLTRCTIKSNAAQTEDITYVDNLWRVTKMPAYLTFSDIDLASLEATTLAELQALNAEAMGWQPLGEGAYLHHGDANGELNVIHVVGVPDVNMAGMNVLLLG